MTAMDKSKMEVSDSKSLELTADSGSSLKSNKSAQLTSIWWKIDLHVLPVLVIMLLLAFLDRNNIGNARVAGIQRDLHITNKQYSVALTLTYIPYILVMVPSNLLLRHVGANRVLPTMTVLWGFTAMMQGFVTTYSGLLACRFFLGVFEGGILPCITLYMSSFYSRYKLQLRVSIFFSTASFTGAFSGLLAAAISDIHRTRRPGWAWIFILEGIFTILFGVGAYFLLPASFAESRFLTDTEKEVLKEKLIQDGIISKNPEADAITLQDIIRTFQSPPVIFMCLACFFGGSTESGLAYFEPSIVQALGHYTPNHAQLMSVPPFAVAFLLSFFSGILSDRYHCRGLTCIFFSTMALVGFSIFLGSDASHIRYGSLFLALSGTYCAAPALGAWTANNAAPYTRRAVALALLNIMTSGGGILSTWLLGFLSSPPKYTKATIVFVVFSAGELIFSIANLTYCKIQNDKKAIIRRTEREEDQKSFGNESAWFVYSL